MTPPSPTPVERLLAWSVHLFTASGLVAGFLGLLAAARHDYRMAMLWLIVAFIIDGIDGTFARLFRVSEVLPNVSGKTIDYVIDFFTYAILPAYIFFEWVELPYGWALAGAVLILLVSALYYGIEGMVNLEGTHFVGFPVMWNLVVYFLLFVFPALPAWVHFALVVVFAIMHFLPIHFAYPSRSSRLRWPTWIVSGLFFLAMIINVWLYPTPSLTGRALSWLALAYFALLAGVDTWRYRKQPIVHGS